MKSAVCDPEKQLYLYSFTLWVCVLIMHCAIFQEILEIVVITWLGLKSATSHKCVQVLIGLTFKGLTYDDSSVECYFAAFNTPYLLMYNFKYLITKYNVYLEMGSDQLFLYRGIDIVYIVSHLSDPNHFWRTASFRFRMAMVTSEILYGYCTDICSFNAHTC